MSKTFRVIITGDRGWFCYRLAKDIIGRLSTRCEKDEDLVIVHGDCPTGVDHAFAEEAENADVTCEPHPADWDRHGKAAGPIRNQEMVDLGARFVLALHPCLSASKGTKDCVRRALAAGIPVWLVDSETAEPRRVVSVDVTGVAP